MPRKDRVINVAKRVTTSRPAISEAERARRQEAVNFSRGSVRYEGGIQTDEVGVIAARYVEET